MAKKKVLSPYQKHKAAKAAKTKANLAETAAYQKKKQAGSLKGRLKKAVSAVSEGVSRRRAKRLAKKGKVSYQGDAVSAGAYTKGAMKRKAVRGDKTGTGKIARGAVGAVATRGGTYAKYKKGSKEAKNFNSAFAAGCKGDAKSFSWQGRSYACKKA